MHEDVDNLFSGRISIHNLSVVRVVTLILMHMMYC